MAVLFTKALNSRSVTVVFVVVLVAFLNQVVEIEARWDDECTTDDQCVGYCCKQEYSIQKKVCKTNCLGEDCSVDDDCAFGECCNSDNVCSALCSLASWIIGVIVAGVIVVVVIPVSIVICCCCCCGAAASRGSARPVILAQPVGGGGGTTVVTSNTSNMQQSGMQYPVMAPQPAYYPPQPAYYPPQPATNVPYKAF